MIQAHYIYCALYFFVLNYYFICWVFAAVCTFLAVAHGLSVVAPGPEGTGSRVEAQGLVAPQQAGSSRTRDGTHSPALSGGFFATEPPGKSCAPYF